MDVILNAITQFTNWVWGIPMLVIVVGGGLYMAACLHFIPFTKLPYMLKNTIGKSFGKKNKTDGFSSWQAVTGALASTLGAGNIIGTAMAIAYGGPGGVFWLWVAGLAACAVKFAEVTLAMKYRHLDENGNWVGGPQYYLSEASGHKWLGIAFSVSCTLCLFLAASAQIGSGVDNIATFNLPRMPVTIVLTVLCGIVVIGGMRGLLSMSEKVVPTMSVLYMLGAIAVVVLNIKNLPGAVVSIFANAFTGHAVVGGFGGATVAACIRWGLCRGVYSNEAGVGYSTMAHAVAEVNHPIQQSMWGVFEVFFDTIVVCSMTCFAILSTGVWMDEGVTASTMTAAAFSSTLGTAGGLIVTISLVLFTFTTACAQVEFGSNSLGHLIGRSSQKFCRWFMLALIFAGGLIGIEALIGYVDFFMFWMIFFNLICVYPHGREIAETTFEYFDNPKRWETEKWSKWAEMESSFRSGAKTGGK